MPLARVIPLFADERPPPTMDSEFWEWGQEHAPDFVNNLAAIARDMDFAENEHQLRSAILELRSEIEAIPGLDGERG